MSSLSKCTVMISRCRWRTRDVEGNLFRQAKSNSKPEAGPPRDNVGADRFKSHLPLQVFCCESGTHIVDAEQSYYREIAYRASPHAHNLSSTVEQPAWDPETQCMDSTQMWFCRDLWTDAARSALKEGRRSGPHKYGTGNQKRHMDIIRRQLAEDAEAAAKEVEAAPAAKEENPIVKEPAAGQADKRQQEAGAGSAEAGTDIDAIDEDAANPAPAPLSPQDLPASAYLIPNHAFTPARILVDPRCVTTYGGVSHTQLARDLFGEDTETAVSSRMDNYMLEDWAGAPDSFVCQEMRTTGGRTAPKSQRRVGFLLQNEVGGIGWGV